MKKKTKLFWLAAIFAAIAMLFASCSDGGDDGYTPYGGGGGGGETVVVDIIHFTIREDGGEPFTAARGEGRDSQAILIDFTADVAGLNLTAAQINLTGAAVPGASPTLTPQSAGDGRWTYRFYPITVNAGGGAHVTINHARFGNQQRSTLVHRATEAAANFFVINWRLLGGEFVGSWPVSGAMGGTTVGHFPYPTRLGHSFGGWFTDPDITTGTGTRMSIPFILKNNLDPVAGWRGFRITYDTPPPTSGAPYATLFAHSFEAPRGYTIRPDALTVRVENTGNLPTGQLNIRFSSTNGGNTSNYFETVPILAPPLPPGEIITFGTTTLPGTPIPIPPIAPSPSPWGIFAIEPRDGIGATGTQTQFTDTVTIVGDYNIIASFTLTFDVRTNLIHIGDPSGRSPADVTTAITNAFNVLNHNVVYVIGERDDFTAPIHLDHLTGTRRLVWRADLAGSGTVISFNGNGTLEIESGSIIATGANGIAIDSTSGTGGSIVITGGLIESVNENADYGTIVIRQTGTTEARLIMPGGSSGVVSNRVYNEANARAINNRSNAAVRISGGTVRANNLGVAIRNSHTGNITVNGGTVDTRATPHHVNGNAAAVGIGVISGGVAIYNANAGTINIDQNITPTLIRTYNNDAVQGTIVIASFETTTTPRLTMAGGTVQNLRVDVSSRAIINHSTGSIGITGGTVEANTGIAIRNESTGIITISQPTVRGTTIASNNGALGTIFLALQPPGTDRVVRLNVQGGTVANNAILVGGLRNAIYSACPSNNVNIAAGANIVGEAIFVRLPLP